MKMRQIIVTVIFLLAVVAMGSLVLADAPIAGRPGRAEVRFLEGMMDHHQMALDMSQDCLNKAKTEAVLKLCQDIIMAQTAEITTMQGYLLKWYNIDYKPITMTKMMGMNDMSSMSGMSMGATPTADGMSGMHMHATDPTMMMGMMAGLSRLEGTEYESAFLESMIDHHDDAVHMSQRLLKRDPQGHPELLQLAQNIITDQTAEIDMMEKMLGG